MDKFIYNDLFAHMIGTEIMAHLEKKDCLEELTRKTEGQAV